MPRTRKLVQRTLPSFFDDSSSPSSPPPARKRTRRVSSSSSSHGQDEDSDVAAIKFEPTEASDVDDSSPRRPKQRASLAGAHAVPVSTVSDESGNESVGAPRCRNRKGRQRAVLDSEDDGDARKPKLIRGARPPTPEEDDDILLGENQVIQSRLRSRGKVTAFQKNLERLKMRKDKKCLESSSEEESESSADLPPFKGAKPHNSGDSSSHQTDDSDANDKDFIVDDDDAHAIHLPPEFSLSTHQDLAHQFKVVCQLFVHIAVQPLVDRRPFFERALKGKAVRVVPRDTVSLTVPSEVEYLSVPLQVTRRKLSGLRDSLVASSVWRPDFKEALEAYPELTVTRMEFMIPQCDACRLGGRKATLLGRLSGRRYDVYDFEDLSDDDDEEGVGPEFHLGRYCAARTRAYHQFSHWEYTLYKALQQEIVEAQNKSRRFVRVAYSGGVRPPRDPYDADKMMEWLDERGIIEREWQRVRGMMDSARNLERNLEDDEDD